MKRVVKIAACLLGLNLILTNSSDIIITANANNSGNVSGGDAVKEADGEFLKDAESIVAKEKTQIIEENIVSEENENFVNEKPFKDTILEEQSTLVAMSENQLEVGNVFYDNNGLFKYEVIAEGEVAIYYTGSRAEISIEIPQTVTYAGNAYYVESNYIVTHIAREAFSDCRNLTRVLIPNSVTDIEESAFAYCDSLKSIEIPNSVTVIGDSAFFNCNNLTNVMIPDSVTTIGSSAFQGCSLIEVVIPDGITNIEKHTFAYTNLKNIEIPDGVMTIGDGAFISCNSLTNVVIPDSVMTIGQEAFRYCGSLTEIVIPDSVIEIKNCTFEGCSSLVSVDMPKEIQILGSWAFDCDQLECVRFKGDAPTNWANDVFGPRYREITIYYPINNTTWTEELKQELSLYANITWIPWDPEAGGSGSNENIPSDATFYLSSGTKSYTYEKDRTIWLMGSFKAIQKGNVSEEAESIVWESSDPLVASINHVSYIPETNSMYGDEIVNTLAHIILYLDCHKPGMVTITGTSADGRTTSETIMVEPKLVAGESICITDSSNVMLCKVELDEKTDEELEYLQIFLNSLEVEIIKGTKWDLEPVCLTGDGFVGLYTYVNADSVSSSIAFEIISPGGQVVQVDVQNDVAKSINTVVYFKGNDKENLTFNYSIDSCLEKSAKEYNPDLAYMLVALATSAYQKEGSDFTLLKDAASGTFPDNPLVITESLRNLGFNAENGDVREFNYYSNATDENYLNDTTAFTIATKEMIDGTTLIAIVVRGSYGDIEKWTSDWRSNVNFQNWGVGLHEGFNTAANEIIKELNAFKDDKSISDDNVTYVITGHSRGAAVANLVAKKLIDSGTSLGHVYDYNFACPDSGRDFAINWNPNGKYDSIYNINNVRDIVGVIPGNLFNSSLNTNTIPSLNMPNIIFWGKYGHTYFFAENWNNVLETMIGGFDQHESTLYLDQMSKKQLIDRFKSWEQARATLAANVMRETYVKNGKVFGVFCPVDFEIIDQDGVKIAEVVNGQSQYYSESFGDVAIVTAGDQSLVYINGKNNYFVKITGYDTGEMTYYVSDAVLGNEYGKEIIYANVPISQGKTMISILGNDKQSDKVTLVLFDEDLNPVKQIDCDGTEQELSDALKEEYSNLPLGRAMKQYNITYNLDGGQEVGNPTTYTKDTATFTLINPTKKGYTFIGWTGSNGDIPKVAVTIDQGMTGDLFYIANWKRDSSGTNVGTANSDESGTNNSISINTNANDNAHANITATNSSARDAVPRTGDTANTVIPLIVICILAFGVIYVQKGSKSVSNSD